MKGYGWAQVLWRSIIHHRDTEAQRKTKSKSESTESTETTEGPAGATWRKLADPALRVVIHHGASDWARPVWWGKKQGCASRFLASVLGYAKSLVSNNHRFCFLGDTEAERNRRLTTVHANATRRRVVAPLPRVMIHHSDTEAQRNRSLTTGHASTTRRRLAAPIPRVSHRLSRSVFSLDPPCSPILILSFSVSLCLRGENSFQVSR
jgi:hypothetical protein